MKYDITDFPEGIDTNKIEDLRKCITFHYSCFLRIYFTFQPKIYNGCHDVTEKSLSLDDIVIVSVKRHELIFGLLLKMKLKANKKCWSKQKGWTAMIIKNYYFK